MSTRTSPPRSRRLTRPSEAQTTIVKLQRALEDVLDKLGMPSLDSYSQPPLIPPQQARLETRGNTEDPHPLRSNERDPHRNLSPDPLNSLMEATKLNGLRSQLRTANLRRKGGMRRMDSDLVAENIVSYAEAVAMLERFKNTQSDYLFSASVPADSTVQSIRTSSTVLFEAIILATALHIPGKERLHETCRRRIMSLASAAMFDRFHTLDDIRGLCIAAMWQPDLSWKLSGLGMRMATELNLQHALYETFNAPAAHQEGLYSQQDCLEKARVWYLLYLLDHQSGVAYGRPPMNSALRPIKDVDLLLQSELCTPLDRALLAQVTGFAVLSKAFDHFGLEPKRTMAGTDESLLNHSRFTDELLARSGRWTKSHDFGLTKAVMLQYHFSDLVLHSVVLRGRSLDKIADLPACLRPLALKAIRAAHSILQHFLQEISPDKGLVGMPFYLHSMVAFAVVFLLKLSTRWQDIGIGIDPHTQSWPLVESIVELLRSYQTGKDHMVYKMADGFERMLVQVKKTNAPFGDGATSQANLPVDSSTARAQPTSYGVDPIPTASFPAVPSVQVSGQSSALPYGNWNLESEQSWPLGGGYDLLGLSDQGLFGDVDFLTL